MKALGLPPIQFGIELEHDAGIGYNIDTLASSIYQTGYGYNDKAYGHHSMKHSPFFFHQRGWLTETDESVTGGEIISPVMTDSDETWTAVNTIVNLIIEHNGSTHTTDSSCHIHLDTSVLGTSVEKWGRFFSYVYQYQDLLTLIGTNPVRGTHRQNGNSDFDNQFIGMKNVRELVESNVSCDLVLSTRDVDPVTGNGHIEYRLNDASLDVGVIRAQVACLVGMMWSAVRMRKAPKNKDLNSFLDAFLVDSPSAYAVVEDCVVRVSDSRGLGREGQLDYALLC